MSIKTRFAPSPTGYLHVGGARTALFSWLYAKNKGGKFVLRIEDTDLARSTKESVNAILDGMKWLGLDYDEGPVYQTQRFERYQAIIQKLLDQGSAYYCSCSKERLDEMREGQKSRQEKPRYDGCCRNKDYKNDNASFVVRFKNPEIGDVVIDDLVKGKIIINNKELDDLIIARSDGTPTYNLTVVVDDMDMAISHVIRGDDHINNTPRQINILTALGVDLPQYAHLPMILGSDGARLSKRHGAVSVMQYRDEGFLPEALLNYLVRLGWSFGDQEIFSLDEMVELFKLEDVNVAASTFNPEKLLWLNHHYMMNSEPIEVAKHLDWHLKKLGIDSTTGADPVLLVKAQRERCKTLVEMAEASLYFYKDFEHYNEKAAKKNFKAGSAEVLESLFEQFSTLDSWDGVVLHQIVLDTAEAMALKLGKVAQPLRVAVCGCAVSPAIDVTLSLLGRERVLHRIKTAINYIKKLDK